MQEENFLYPSPLGQIFLKVDAEYLKVASFINEEIETAKIITLPKSALLLKTINCLDRYFSGEDLSLHLPVQQDGTEFQQKVWKALLTIKPGFTQSYLGLSKIIGNAKAIRAVGAANGKNNIALIVPCHRVIGSNGKLIGYASGLWRKSWLLQHEAKFTKKINLLF